MNIKNVNHRQTPLGDFQVLKVVTKMIAKENILPWQRKGGQLLEAEILMNITHINVVSCLDLYQNTEYIHIVMEYCPGKTLFDLVEHISKIPENLARILFKQVRINQFLDDFILHHSTYLQGCLGCLLFAHELHSAW